MGFLTIKPKTAATKESNTKANKGKTKNKNKGQTVQEYLDVQYISKNIIQNTGRSKYYIKISPKNINILTDAFLLNEIRNLKMVCNVAESVEFLTVDKVERLEDNKNYIEKLLEEDNDEIYEVLLEKDLEYFKELETSKGSSREFYLVISFKNGDFNKLKNHFIKVEQTLNDMGFTVLDCSKNVLKNMLQVYFERNFSGDVISDFDINIEDFGL